LVDRLAGDGFRDQLGHASRVLEAREVRDAGKLDRGADIAEARGELAALIAEEGKIELAPDDRGGRGDLAEVLPGRGLVRLGVLGPVGGEGDRVHLQEQLAGRAADAALGCDRAVEPEPRLESVDG